MKYIRKAGSPHDYATWCHRVRGTQDEDYRCLQNPEKASLHHALLREQGWLCAYTMIRIEEVDSHIEHIKPESLCREEHTGSDLEYSNLVACFPRDGMGKTYRYGAQQKANWWDNGGADFVSPLHPNCEKRFCFDLDGKINAVRNHKSALKTIEVLKLDHKSLTEDRRRVIQEFVYGENGSDALTAAQAVRAIKKICEIDPDGRFYEFCIAIRDALDEHLNDIRKIAKQWKFRGRN